MIIKLERFAYLGDCTRGALTIGNHTFQTIEKPWVAYKEAAGGTPFESCIPDSTYRLRAHIRPGGRKAFILSNSNVGVFEQDADRPASQGRYLILIHPGNTVEDVVGCIAPGLTGGDRYVHDSRKAMKKIHELLEGFEHELVIYPKGTSPG